VAVAVAVAAAVAVVLVLVLGRGGGHTASIDPSAVPTRATLARTTIPTGVDWPRFNLDAQRSGVDPAATGLNAHNVGALRLRTVKLPGTVDSSAIELHGIDVGGRSHDVLVMTTTYGRTLALDLHTARILWQFTPGDIRSYQGSAQITTATPIADPDRRFVYASSPDGRIHKLAVATGHEVRSGFWPVSVTYDPTHEKIASALNISGSSLVVVTDGYIGDAPPYQGHVVMINRRFGMITAVWNALCSDRHAVIVPRTCSASDAAIWGRDGAVIEPGTGRILVATGNAVFNGTNDWGDSVLELSPDGTHLLHNWTPADQAQLNSNDQDLGSTSPAVLPTYQGRRLAVQGGKAGVLDLLDLDRLNGTTGGPSPRTGGQIQQIPSPGSDQVFTAPAVWSHGGRIWAYVADGAGTDAYVLTGGGAHPRLRMAWASRSGGTSPVIAGGLLYVYDPSGALDIYVPTTGHRLVSLPAGSGHWNSPIVVGGRVILPVGNANDHDTSGTLDIFHLPGH
jgi:outer membrane protein assembly factor BamB